MIKRRKFIQLSLFGGIMSAYSCKKDDFPISVGLKKEKVLEYLRAGHKIIIVDSNHKFKNRSLTSKSRLLMKNRPEVFRYYTNLNKSETRFQMKKEITRDVKIYAIGLLLDTGLIANHEKELGRFDMKNINGGMTALFFPELKTSTIEKSRRYNEKSKVFTLEYSSLHRDIFDIKDINLA